MTNKCNYCKQVKRCRKQKIYSDGAGVGYTRHYIATEWICKDCDDYFAYERKEAEKQSKIDEGERVKDFIKKRDKCLKSNAEVVKGGDK